MPEATRGPVEPIAEALRGCEPGVVGVQLRAKASPDHDLVAWGRRLRSVTRAAGCPLVINGRPDVAQIVEAEGVHLPERGLPIAEVRAGWPTLALVGVSRHDRNGLLEARRGGADFAFLSPVFAVPEKSEPIGVDGFREAIAAVGIPTYALGGVNTEHVAALCRAGAAGVAVRRILHEAASPQTVLEAFLRTLDNSASPVG